MSLPARQLPEYRSEKCLNCETPLEKADKFCHQCGQINSKKRLSLNDFFSEFLSNFISYDSRIWRTISGILFQPGKVTKEYCAGRRKQYANPFRFFLTVSIVFFLLGQVVFNWDGDFGTFVNSINKGFAEGRGNISESKELKALIKQRDSLEAAGNIAGSKAISSVIETLEGTVTDSLKTTKYLTEAELEEKNYFSRYLEQTFNYKKHAENNPEMNVSQALNDLGHEQNGLNTSRYRKALRFNELEERPYQMVEMIVPKIPLFLFFFAPVISLFLWLLYMRQPFNFMEHLVFTFHVFTFFFLCLFVLLGIVGLTFGLIGWEWPAIIILGLFGPVYFYKALRKFYNQSRIKTILKFLFLNFVFFLLFMFSAGLFIVGSVFIGA